MRQKMLAISMLFFAPGFAFAGPCDAGFNFDGNLSDVSGNAQNGVIIGKGGTLAQPIYVAGRQGKALRFDGTTAMRISSDLHYDVCPRITLTAWINIDGASSTRSQTILSTGNGNSPGLRIAGTILAMNGPGNGIHQQSALMRNGGWQFVAAVYDFENDTYTMYWGGRNSKPQSMNGRRYEPDAAVWIGASNDAFTSAATEMSIDDLRIIGRALSPAEINQLRTSTLSVSTASAGQDWAGLEPVIDGDVPADSQIGETEKNLSTGQPTQPLSGQLSSVGPANQDDIAATATGVSGTMTANSTVSTGAMDTIKVGAEENAPPVLPGASNDGDPMDSILAGAQENAPPTIPGGSSDGAEAPPAEDETTPANFSIITFSDSVLRSSGISGGSGDFSERIIFARQNLLPYFLETREHYDKPCRVFAHFQQARLGIRQPSPSRVYEADVCSGGAPRINPLSTLDNRPPQPGDFKPITGIQVCNNGSNQRVKGIRARVQGIQLPSGLRMSNYSTVVYLERSNCRDWESMAYCPGNTFAIGLTLHFRDGDRLSPRDYLSGVELQCADLQLEDFPALGNATD